MIFFKLYISDYQGDTADLSLAEHGAYLLMLQHYYATERPLPEGKALYRILRAETKQEREAVDAVASRFWTSSPEGLRHQRADEELEKASRQREVNRETGKRGGRPRKTESVLKTETEMETESETESVLKKNPSQTSDVITPPSLRSGGVAHARAQSATRLPPGWKPPDADFGFATGLIGLQAARDELAKFSDYWAGKAGRDGAKLDWPATWRNWIRRTHENRSRRSHQGAGRLSAVERVRLACNLDDDGFPLGADDGNLRPPLGEQLWVEADGDLGPRPVVIVA